MGSNAPKPIIVDIPEGFYPQCMPCDSKTRFHDSHIKVELATEADLRNIALGVATCFPDIWWDKHRPTSGEPSPEWRIKCLSERVKPMLTLPGFFPVKATINGEFAGFAGWHGPERKGFFASMFTTTAFKEFQFDKMLEWSEKDLENMWSDVSMESWNEEFESYDITRRKILGELPHWYLAPLFVFEKFRGRGVGGKLLEWANRRADSTFPKTPLFLEALPNARPVYLHMGYEAQEGEDRTSVMIRNDPRKWVRAS